MYANRDRANRPDRITAADRARQRQAIARHDARIASANRRERFALLIVYACFIVAAIMGISAATDTAPADSATYRATGWDGATIARGMSLGECMDIFTRPDVAGCNRE